MAKGSSKKVAKVVAEKPKREGLTHRQRFFVLEYLVDGNGTRAAKAAGYAQDDATAAVQASRLLRIAKVRTELERHQAARAERLQINADQVIRELSRVGYTDIRGLFNENGCAKPIQEWPEDLARAVAGVEVYEEFENIRDGFECYTCGRISTRALIGYTKKFKLWDKPKALNLLGLDEGRFKQKHEHEVEISLADLVAASTGAEGEKK